MFVTDVTDDAETVLADLRLRDAELRATAGRIVLTAAPARRASWRRPGAGPVPGQPALPWQLRYEWLQRFGGGRPRTGPARLRFVVEPGPVEPGPVEPGPVEPEPDEPEPVEPEPDAAPPRRLAVDVHLADGADALAVAQLIARRVGAFWQRRDVPVEQAGWVQGLLAAPLLPHRSTSLSLYKVPMAVPVRPLPGSGEAVTEFSGSPSRPPRRP
ncbi:MAG TPA: hypothetical protein VM433_13070 [Mycobacteriales bacterium]|nr:hypothetical protein [Mycobacteriales bacterium]